MMDIQNYWASVLRQDARAMRKILHPDALVRWHNTNECFTAEEFIRANCEYPGDWKGEIEKTVYAEDQIITAVHVYSADNQAHFHVTSFLKILNNKIVSIDEYWGDDGPAPLWRRELSIGKPIK